MNYSDERFESYAHLNDAGIFLLQRHCYRQAFAKFEAASRAIQKDDEHTLGRTGRRLLRTDSLDRSLEAFPHPPSVQCSDLSLKDLKSTSQVLELLQSGGESQEEVTVAIRLDGKEEEFADKHAKSIAAAVVAYNLALAHQTFAKGLLNKRRQDQSNVQLKEASRLFEIAQGSLKRVCKKLSSPQQQNNSLHKVLILRMIVLLGLHTQISGTAEARKVEGKISRIDSKISSLLPAGIIADDNNNKSSDNVLMSPRKTIKPYLSTDDFQLCLSPVCEKRPSRPSLRTKACAA